MLDFIKRLFQTKKPDTFTKVSNDNSQPEPPVVNSLFDPLWAKVKEQKFEEVITEVKEILNKDDQADKGEARRLLGLCYFQQGKFDLAEQAYLEQTSTSENSDDWFNLVTSSTLNRNIELGEQAYLKAIEFYKRNATNENLPIPQIYYYYMQALRDIKEYERAFLQLEKLKEIYCSLSITDSTFLYIRGVPFFQTAIESSKEILENIERGKAESFMKALHNGVDDDGKQYLDEFQRKLSYRS
ncbi:MAG TPA: hypothetical protein VK154_06860 [Chitinophagales bacterium]|nr:hypothetical protein [Chitinophagales bacterium]